MPTTASPTPQIRSQAEQDYLFDLLGYRIIKGALEPRQVREMNQWIDAQPPRKPGDWAGNVQVHSYQGHDGTNYQNVIEGGPVFEELIDHPSWHDDVERYICNDYHRLSINENFLNVRESGGFIGIHSGGHVPGFPCVVRHHTGRWMIGMINILMALTDIGPGDGATTLIPGSHKSHEVHPALRTDGDRAGKMETYDEMAIAGAQVGMIEAHLNAGDALMFVDGICHGSAERLNKGQRRVVIYRYAPQLLIPRYNYLPSEELLERLTPRRKAIINPIPPRFRPGRVIKG